MNLTPYITGGTGKNENEFPTNLPLVSGSGSTNPELAANSSATPCGYVIAGVNNTSSSGGFKTHIVRISVNMDLLDWMVDIDGSSVTSFRNRQNFLRSSKSVGLDSKVSERILSDLEKVGPIKDPDVPLSMVTELLQTSDVDSKKISSLHPRSKSADSRPQVSCPVTEDYTHVPHSTPRLSRQQGYYNDTTSSLAKAENKTRPGSAVVPMDEL